MVLETELKKVKDLVEAVVSGTTRDVGLLGGM